MFDDGESVEVGTVDLVRVSKKTLLHLHFVEDPVFHYSSTHMFDVFLSLFLPYWDILGHFVFSSVWYKVIEVFYATFLQHYHSILFKLYALTR